MTHRRLNIIDTVVLHQSKSSLPAHDDISVIDGWHKERGFADGEGGYVGYQYFIKFNGEIQIGRPLDRIPAAVKGYNKQTVNICLHGTGQFTDEQLRAAARIIEAIRLLMGKRLPVVGHCDLDPEKPYCPGIDIDQFIYDYLT